MSRDTPPRPSANWPRAALLNSTQAFARAIVNVRHVTFVVIARQVLREDVSWIELAWNVEQLDYAEADKLLQQTDASRDVCETLQWSGVLGHHDGDLIVTPYGHRLVTNDAKRDEAHDACNVQQLRCGDRRSEQLRGGRVGGSGSR